MKSQENSEKGPDVDSRKSSASSEWLDKVVLQAVSLASSLANDAARSALGAKVKEQVEHFVEETGPQVAKKVTDVVQDYAAEVASPYQLGMGLEVSLLQTDKIEAVLPHRWRNRSSSGAVHSSALFALAEFTAKSYWEKQWQEQLVGAPVKMTLQEIQGRFFESSYRRVRATMDVAEEVLEEKMSILQSQGVVTISATVILRKKGDSKIAEFSLLWMAETPTPSLSNPPPKVVN